MQAGRLVSLLVTLLGSWRDRELELAEELDRELELGSWSLEGAGDGWSMNRAGLSHLLDRPDNPRRL